MVKKDKEVKTNKGKINIKSLLKKSPKATYQIPTDPDYQRSSFFNTEYEKEKNIVSWK
jgi:hypothetical protein